MLAFKTANSFQEMSVYRGTPDYGILSNPLGNLDGTSSANAGPGQSVFSAFGGDGRMLRMAAAVFNQTEYAGSSENVKSAQKQKAFAGFLGGMYALWGNQAFERNANTQWRMSPAYNYIPGTSATSQQANNNGFTLEVQFSKPILHCDTSLGASAFGHASSTESTVNPYQFLTVSGQGIVRYAQTIKNS
jgi:hypothetical protein